MADEYIKRSIAINQAICASFWAANQPDKVTGEIIMSRFNSIPSEDVAPVKHGRWETMWQKEDPDTSVECRCSLCKRISKRPVGDFCKWCGAKMDGET